MIAQSKNMVLIGDNLFLDYHLLLSSKLLYLYPDTCPHLLTVQKTELTFENSLNLISQYIIGKSPHYLFIHLGSLEIESSVQLAKIFEDIDHFFNTININIQPKKFIVGSCEILFSNQPKKIERLKKINKYLKSKFPNEYIDLNYSSKKILKKIIHNNGEKQALHQAASKLTPFGQLVFTEIISKIISF